MCSRVYRKSQVEHYDRTVVLGLRLGPTTQMGNPFHDPKNSQGNTLIAFLSETQSKIV